MGLSFVDGGSKMTLSLIMFGTLQEQQFSSYPMQFRLSRVLPSNTHGRQGVSNQSNTIRDPSRIYIRLSKRAVGQFETKSTRARKAEPLLRAR